MAYTVDTVFGGKLPRHWTREETARVRPMLDAILAAPPSAPLRSALRRLIKKDGAEFMKRASIVLLVIGVAGGVWAALYRHTWLGVLPVPLGSMPVPMRAIILMLLLSTVVVWAFQVSVLRGKLDTVSLLNELDRSQKPTGAWLMQYPLIDRWPLMQVTAPFCEAQWNLDMHAAT